MMIETVRGGNGDVSSLEADDRTILIQQIGRDPLSLPLDTIATVLGFSLIPTPGAQPRYLRVRGNSTISDVPIRCLIHAYRTLITVGITVMVRPGMTTSEVAPVEELCIADLYWLHVYSYSKGRRLTPPRG